MKTLSLRGRLTLWYMLVLMTVLSTFGAAVVWTQGRISVRRVDAEIGRAHV